MLFLSAADACLHTAHVACNHVDHIVMWDRAEVKPRGLHTAHVDCNHVDYLVYIVYTAYIVACIAVCMVDCIAYRVAYIAAVAVYSCIVAIQLVWCVQLV